jgi:hypothetical protein
MHESQGDLVEPGRTPRVRPIAFIVFLLALLLYLPLHRGHFTGTDAVSAFAMTRSIAAGRGLEVPRLRHTEIGHDGRRYSYFAVGQSVLALPFYAAGVLASEVLPYDWRLALSGPRIVSLGVVYGGDLPRSFVLAFAPVATAALVALFFLFELELGVSLRSSLIAAALFATTTYVAPMSTFFLRHSLEACAIIGALLCLVRYRAGASLGALAAGSALAASIPLIRVPAAIAAPALGGYLLYVAYRRNDGFRDRRATARAALAVALPILAALAIYMWVNWSKWGGLLESPMVGQRSEFNHPIGRGLAGFLLSPGTSIFVYSPLLCLLPLTLPGFWRRHRAETLTCVAMVLCFLLFNARFDRWTGLWSAPGPRYVFIATPLLMLPLGQWLDGATSARRGWTVAVIAIPAAVMQLALSAVRWGMVPRHAGYPMETPDVSSFLFEPERSPVWITTRLLLRGELIDLQLLRIWHGWPGFAGRPGIAATLLLVWCIALAACGAWLIREVKRAPDAFARPMRGV